MTGLQRKAWTSKDKTHFIESRLDHMIGSAHDGVRHMGEAFHATYASQGSHLSEESYVTVEEKMEVHGTVTKGVFFGSPLPGSR